VRILFQAVTGRSCRVQSASIALVVGLLAVACAARRDPPSESAGFVPPPRLPPAAEAGAEPRRSETPMVEVPASRFSVEVDDKGVRGVATAAFAIDATEVSVSSYAECVDAKRCTPPRRDSDRCHPLSADSRYPVNCIDLSQARAFCAWTGKRLPTEDEWIAAAVAGRPEPAGHVRRSSASGFRKRNKLASVEDNARDDRASSGVFGMRGNVVEWTTTPFEPGAQPVSRVVTMTMPAVSHATAHPRAAHAAYPDLGFRCVRSELPDPFAAVPLEVAPPAPDMTEAELRERYVQVWKKLVASFSNVSSEVLERGVTVRKTELSQTQSTTYLAVSYSVTVDWATAEGEDLLRVRLDASAESMPKELPRDRWLEPAEIERFASVLVHEGRETRLPLTTKLKFASRAEALGALRRGTRTEIDAAEVRVVLAARPPGLLLVRSPHRRPECWLGTLELASGKVERRSSGCNRMGFD
jgi:formylglycine-generating enzyme required for sulfatase activity